MELKLENMSEMSEEELRIAIKAALDHARESSPIDRFAMLQEAQFYTRELERRDDAFVAKRDFWLEVIVIGLITMELLLGFYQEKEQSKTGTQQQEVLGNLQKSTAATAATMEKMNTAMQSELDLNYAVNAVVDFDNATKRARILNTSRTLIFLMAVKAGSYSGFNTERMIIQPGETHTLGLDFAAKELFKTPITDPVHWINVQFYFRNLRDEGFIGTYVLARIDDGHHPPTDLALFSKGIVKGDWAMPPTSSTVPLPHP
jgi:hypothetical protein